MRRLSAAGATAMILAAWSAAGATPLALDGPEVLKLDWGVRALAPGDVDQDGLMDLAVINNDRARVEILYQREPGEARDRGRSLRPERWAPVLEDARFERVSAASGIAMFDLELGDVTGDGAPDVIFTSKDEPLVIVPQLEDGLWGDKREFDGLTALPWNSTLQLVELSDEHPGLEIVMIAKDALMVFAVDESGAPAELHRAHRLDSGGGNLSLLPARDGRPLRFAYRAPGSSRALRLIEWMDGQGPGPERAIPMNSATPDFAWIDPVDGEPALIFIEPRTSRLRVESLREADPATEPGWPLEFYTTGAAVDHAAAYANGDFDGDGHAEIVVADSANAQVWRLEAAGDGGWRAPQSYPSFQGVKGVLAADIDGDGQSELVSLSEKENTVGVSTWNGERFTFPQVIELSGEPKLIHWLPGAKRLVALVRDGRDFEIQLLEHQDPEWSVVHAIPLPGVRRDPTGLLAADLDQNGSRDLLVAVPSDGARYVDLASLDSLSDDEMAKAVSEIEGLRDLELLNTGLGDVNGDGQPELLVADEGFVRAIALDERKRRTVVDQFNARSGSDRVSIPHLRNVDDDEALELLLFNDKAKEFQILERDEAGIFRYAKSSDFGDVGLVGLLENTPNQDLVALGKNAVVRSPLGRTWKTLETSSSYESDLEDIVYNEVAVADFDGNGAPDFVFIDGQNNVLEIIEWEAPDNWRSRLHFNVFEEDIHYGGRTGAPLEPREILIGDFTGDGREDIALLVHDRLLLYPQRNVPPEGDDS